MVCHHPAKFGGHRHCGSGDMLICHISSRDHVFKESCDFMFGSLSLKVNTRLNLVATQAWTLPIVILAKMCSFSLKH